MVNTFRQNNILLTNNNLSMNNLKQYQLYNNIGRKSYEYNKNEDKKNMKDDLSEDIKINKNIYNKNRLIKNKNYSKDFLDIITNKNNDNHKYDYVSIYNNIINQKKDDYQNINNNTNNNNYIEEKYNNIISKLKCKSFDEIINKIDKLLNYEKFVDNIYSLYDKNNNNNKYKENNLKNIFSWIESNIGLNKKYKDELKKYQNFCGKLMEEFRSDGFDKFKNEIMETVYKTKNNQSYNFGMQNYNSNNNYSIYSEKRKLFQNNENLGLNSHVYIGNNNNSQTANKTHSINNLKNGDENTLTNIKNKKYNF